jgi:hypothetical protein
MNQNIFGGTFYKVTYNSILGERIVVAAFYRLADAERYVEGWAHVESLRDRHVISEEG